MAKILIVDDASFMRGTLKYIAEGVWHNVVGTAEEGGEALELYRKLKPDLVILDILMKGMDGLSALAAIRKEDPGAKVIMVTALGQEEKQKEARKLGASGYIRKPFKQKEIIDEIERVLGGDGKR
ncbi:MAG: response regulator [Gammaproteobacteria bacterium]|nr:response regulator [Gammaproteobacteria bacterium]